jgi:hypothetical protein
MFKGHHFDPSVTLLSIRWYLAVNLSLRGLEEMMAERGLGVDHSTWAANTTANEICERKGGWPEQSIGARNSSRKLPVRYWRKRSGRSRSVDDPQQPRLGDCGC